MARLIQDPGGKRPGTALVLRGKQGTGKGFFVNTFGKVFGNHFIQITNQTQLTGKFNNHLKDKLLVFVDEGFWAGDKSAEGVLKGLITEDRIIVEPKGKDAFSVRNHINIIMASNNDWIVPAGLEERRFMVTDVSDHRIQDKKYFRSIQIQMNSGGLEAMFHDLKNLDITTIDLRTIPRTEALLSQIISSMSIIKKFWFEILDSGKTQISGDWPTEIPSDILFNEYLEFAQNIGYRYRKGNSQFYKELYELLPTGCEKIQRREGNIRRRYLKMPELHECRTHFENILRIQIPWSDEAYEDRPVETRNPFISKLARSMSKGSG
jgi:phage/plasmid-associated DNA primase